LRNDRGRNSRAAFCANSFTAADSSSESQVAKLVGQVATVITPIPAGGVGEIAYVQAGTRYTAPAREESGVLVTNGSEVKITRVVVSIYVAAKVAAKAL
jgi:hypothetical protein